MHVALNQIDLSDNVHALTQRLTATSVHPIECAALDLRRTAARHAGLEPVSSQPKSMG
jgi:hypothetical protein